MKRSVQEIIELLVFGLIAVLVGTGLLWVVGWAIGGLGALFKLLAGLIWSLLRFVVPIAVVGAAVYALVRLLQGQREPTTSTAASSPGAPGPTGASSSGTAASSSAPTSAPPPPAATPPQATGPEDRHADASEEHDETETEHPEEAGSDEDEDVRKYTGAAPDDATEAGGEHGDREHGNHDHDDPEHESADEEDRR